MLNSKPPFLPPPSPSLWQSPFYSVSMSLITWDTPCKWNCAVSVLLWLISRSMMSSSLIYVVMYGRVSSFFKCCIIFWWMSIPNFKVCLNPPGVKTPKWPMSTYQCDIPEYRAEKRRTTAHRDAAFPPCSCNGQITSRKQVTLKCSRTIRKWQVWVSLSSAFNVNYLILYNLMFSKDSHHIFSPIRARSAG